MIRWRLLIIAPLIALAAFSGCQKPVKPLAPARVAPPSRAVVKQEAEAVREQTFPELKRSTLNDEQVAKNVRDGKEPFAHLMGYKPQPQQNEQFIRSLPAPTLREANPQLFPVRGPPPASQYAAEQPVLLYRARYTAHLRKFGEPWKPASQEIGDCVSHGYALACETLLAIDFVTGRSGDFQKPASEGIYGLARVEGAGRTYTPGGDGSYGSAACKGLMKFGVPFRLDYRNVASAECDLRQYSGTRARSWGAWGCGGRDDAGRLDSIVKQNPVIQVALITTWEETVAAITNGYPIAVCSGQGFGYATDVNGFAPARGNWPHCMEADSIRFDIEAVLITNSWGDDWIDQSRGVYPSDQPKGSFWCRRSTWERMIAGRDTYAITNVRGFPRRNLFIREGL